MLFNQFQVPMTRENVFLFLVYYRLIVPVCLSWIIIAYGDDLAYPERLKKEWIFSLIFRFTRIHQFRRFVVSNGDAATKHAENEPSLFERTALFFYRLIRPNYYFHPIILVCITCYMQTLDDIGIWSMVRILTSFPMYALQFN